MTFNILSRLFDRFRTVPRTTETPTVASAERRIYAIGDIHGFADLLDRLTSMIEADLAEHPHDDPLAVFLGDYVDRGPASARIIDRLAERRFPIPFETLRGNHEELMLQAIADADAMSRWCQAGGIETLQSYGLDVGKAVNGKRLNKLRLAFIDRLPDEHLAFLRATRMSFTEGDYFFAHAGARPGVALDRQAAEDLLWIREPFLTANYDFGKTVVHGHTPRPYPENEQHRINVDTGVFKWGVLSCAVLEGSKRRFLSTRDEDREAERS